MILTSLIWILCNDQQGANYACIEVPLYDSLSKDFTDDLMSLTEYNSKEQ